MEQAKVTRGTGGSAASGSTAGAQLKHIKRTGEQEGKLQGGTYRGVRVGRGVVGGEDGRVEGVVL